MGSDSKTSGRSGGGDNVEVSGGGGGLSIPAADKKVVQNLKEIVGKNCTEAEIYAVLLECNMDADEAVHRLLSQDTFHEVKSKRERRKEGKETQETRSRSNNGVSSKGVRLGTEYVAGRTGLMENSYNDAEIGKSFYKRESGAVIPSVSSSSYVYRATGKILNEKPLPNSESSNADNGRQLAGVGDSFTSSVQPSSGFQSSWVSNEHVSLADIVKRGSSQNIGSQMSSDASYTHQPGSSNFSHNSTKSSQISSATDPEIHQDYNSPYHYNVPETVIESGVTYGQQGFDNQWSKMEHVPAGIGFGASSVSDAGGYYDQSGLRSDTVNLYRNSVPEEFQVRGDHRLNINYDESDAVASGQIVVNCSKGASIDGQPNEIGSSVSNVSNGHMHKHLEGSSNSREVPFTAHPASLKGDVLSVTANLQQLHIRKEETAKHLIEDCSTLVLPDHLQDFAAGCSHLSFGTYKSGIPTSVSTSSCPSKSDLEVYAGDGASALRQDIRNSGYQDHKLLGFHKVAADSRNIPLQPELPRPDVPVTTHEDQYMTLTSRVPEPSDRNVQLASNFSDVIDANAKNVLSPNEMLMYSKPIPSDLFDSPVQSLRSQEPPQFVTTHSVSSRYGHALSSMNGPISMPEDLPSTNLIQGNILSQHLPMHPYSKHDLSLEKLANLGGYGSMPQNQTYVPSTLPQAFPVESMLHESLASTNYNFSRYRSDAAINNMHLSDGGDPGYGSIHRNSTNLPGSFLHNMSSHSIAGASYNDLLRSQFNDGSVISHQQNNNFPTWDSGYASRATTVHPESLYYNSLLGQNAQQHQQHPVYRQGQQATPHHESLDQYSRTYSSRTGIGRDPQQNFSDSSLTDFQGTTANQLNRIWGHNF